MWLMESCTSKQTQTTEIMYSVTVVCLHKRVYKGSYNKVESEQIAAPRQTALPRGKQ